MWQVHTMGCYSALQRKEILTSATTGINLEYILLSEISQSQRTNDSTHKRFQEWSTLEKWASKNWCFWTVMLERTLESPLNCKDIQPVNPKGNQSWIFIWRTVAKAEKPILWPPDVKNWLVGKDPDARNDWRLEEKGTTEDEMVGWHHRFDGSEFEHAPGVGDGQGGLACCSPRGC